MHIFKGLDEEELWKSLINTARSYLLIAPVSYDGLDSLIGPGGLLLLVYHLVAVPVLSLWAVLERKVFTKTWIWEIFSQTEE